jgi:hypothetical protein
MYNWLDIKKIDLFEKPINPTQIFFFLWIMFGQRRKKREEFLSWLSLIMLLPRKGQRVNRGRSNNAILPVGRWNEDTFPIFTWVDMY